MTGGGARRRRRGPRPEHLVVAGALALRLVHVLTIRDYPLFDVLSLDSESYDAWARRIAAGELLGERPFYQAPLYAYFLAGLHRLSGGDLLLPRIVNAILGAAHVAIVMRIARRTFGSGAALAAGILVALHGTFLFEEGKVMKTSLGLVLGSGMLALLIEARRASGRRAAGFALAAGLAGGAAALVRENFLLFGAAAVAWSAWRRPAGGGWRPAGALALGLALAILPATLHNALPDGELLPITSQAGQNLYTGLHPGNEDGGYLVPDFVRRSPRFEEIDFAAEAERRAGRVLTAGEVSRWWLGESRAVIRSEPGRVAGLFFRKLGLLFHDFEIPDDEDVRFLRRWAPVLRLPMPGFGLLATLGIVGLALAVAQRRAPGELVLFLVVYPISVAIFFVFSRYRLPMVGPLAVFGGWLLVRAGAAVRERRGRALAWGGLAAAGVGAFLFRPVDAGTTLANSHLSVGIAHEVEGRAAAAIREYEAGLALEPEHAKLLKRTARLRAAEVGRPGGPRPDDPELLALLRRAVAANPREVELRFRLGALLGAAGDLAGAVAQFETIVAQGSEPPGIHANLAIAYERLGRRGDATREAAAALERNPQDAAMLAILERAGAGP